jgi:hypothetical protein
MANEINELTRRDFAKAAVAAAVAPALAACATTMPEMAPGPDPAPAATAPAPAAASAPGGGQQEPTPLARALAEAIRVQYGDRMTEAEMAKVQRSISGVLSTAERVRRFPLPISTEPTLVYRVPGGAR